MPAPGNLAAPSNLSRDSDDTLAVRIWLLSVAFLVFCMIVIGGATRLTDSGLSITEWQPLLGAIPPLSTADWQEAFDKYRQIPEYHLVNKGMTLDEFKFIYWWEWAHRFFGRLIGVAFAVPFLVFLAARQIPAGYSGKLVGIFLLGGLQGFFGWYMVQSGLSERVDVSHYRLALHLTTAFVILAALLWVALDLARDEHRIRLATVGPTQRRIAVAVLALIFLQVVIGAFVAGLKAGLVHHNWPLMGDGFVPHDLLDLSPWYMNLVENPATTQFVHRLVAYLLLALALWQAVVLTRTADDERVVTSAQALVAVLLAQAALGIAILYVAADGAEIPIGLGLVHQGGGAVVLAVAVLHVHRMFRTTA